MGIKTLLLSIPITIVIISVIFFASIHFGLFNNIQKDTSFYETATAILALVIGAAATVGGAIASITVAQSALRITESQESRDVIQFLEKRIDNTTSLFFNLTLSISELFIAGIMLKMVIEDYLNNKNLQTKINENQKDIQKVEEGLKKDIQEKVRIFQGSLEALRINVIGISKDAFAFDIFQESLSGESYLTYIEKNMESHGFNYLERHISRTNLLRISHFIRIAELHLSRFDYSLDSELNAKVADTPEVGKRSDNGILWLFIFTGNLIHNLNTESKLKNGVSLNVSYGTAILRDLAKSIPNPALIRENLKEAYPKLEKYIEKIPINFDPELMIGEDLNLALTELEKRRDLLFLEKKIIG
ncbi:MAG: hypothetical protein ACM3SY_00395 [Candidatus Omnitrophota bacterium]